MRRRHLIYLGFETSNLYAARTASLIILSFRALCRASGVVISTGLPRISDNRRIKDIKSIIENLSKKTINIKGNQSQYKKALNLRPLQNATFCPISALGSNFNPQNTQCIPVVKIFACLELEQN